MKKFLVIVGLASLLSLGAVEYTIDSGHSSVEFKTKHLLVTNVGGKFSHFSGKVDLEGKTLKVFEGEIDMASVNTDNPKRDEHIKSKDFFDVAQYPKGYFKMTDQKGDEVYGILTLRGASREIVLKADVSDVIIHPKTKQKVVAIEFTGKINRKDFGIGGSIPSTLVGDEVKLMINLELNQK